MSFPLFVILRHFSCSRPYLYWFMMNRVNAKGNKQNRGENVATKVHIQELDNVDKKIHFEN